MSFDLRAHGRRYEFEYPPLGNSDHLPMTWLAMTALGAPPSRREDFISTHVPRLVGWVPGHPAETRQNALLAEIEAHGIAAVLSEHLPRLISGWYRAAYHPLIRLGYGVEFEAPAEIAAGLTYLEACGPSPRLAELATGARHAKGISALELLQRAAGADLDPGAAGAFDPRAETVLAHRRIEDLALVVDDNLRQMSRAALAAFAATHDFFALHLVTASHAFRLLRSWAGPQADAVMNLGLLAGYCAIKAPEIPSEPPASPELPPSKERLLALCRDDEHDFKVAYSAWAQAQHWQDAAYVKVVESYFESI